MITGVYLFMENQPENLPTDSQNLAQTATQNIAGYSRKNSTGVIIFIKKGIISLIGFIRFSVMQIIGQVLGKG